MLHLALLALTAHAGSYAYQPLDVTLAKQPVVMEGKLLQVACGNTAHGFPEPEPVRRGEQASTFLTFEVLEGFKGVSSGDVVKLVISGGCGSVFVDDRDYNFAPGETWLFSAEPNSRGVLRPAAFTFVWRQRALPDGSLVSVSFEGMPIRDLLCGSMQQPLIFPKGTPQAEGEVKGAGELRDLVIDDGLNFALPWSALEADLHGCVDRARALPEWLDPGYVMPAEVR